MKAENMYLKFVRNTRINRFTILAVLGAAALCLFRLPVPLTTTKHVAAQSAEPTQGTITFWDLNTIGLVPGDSLIVTAYNGTESGQADEHRNDDIVFVVSFNTSAGNVIATRELLIPANQFRSTAVSYEDVLTARDPGTGRAQVGVRNHLRTPALWGVRNRAVVALELVGSDGKTRMATNRVFVGRDDGTIQQ